MYYFSKLPKPKVSCIWIMMLDISNWYLFKNYNFTISTLKILNICNFPLIALTSKNDVNIYVYFSLNILSVCNRICVFCFPLLFLFILLHFVSLFQKLLLWKQQPASSLPYLGFLFMTIKSKMSNYLHNRQTDSNIYL